MAEFHFIKDQKLRDILQILVAIVGIVGVIIGILSFIY